MAAQEESRLTDPEYWILLSLDDASPLADLLLGIVRVESGGRRPFRLRGRTSVEYGGRGRFRLPWQRSVEHEVRPALDITEAADALTRLVKRGLVEVREVRENDEGEAPSPGYLDLGWGRPLKLEPHHFDRGRALSVAEVLQVVKDPRNWRYPAEVNADVTYWAAATEVGEAAYQRASHERGA